MTNTKYFPSDVPALREAITLLRQELAVANGPFIAGGRGLHEQHTALDAIETCENLTAAARNIDVDGYRVMMGDVNEYGALGVPVDTIGALRAALAAVELAATLVRRDMGADDPVPFVIGPLA
jgi:hypothetical protein